MNERRQYDNVFEFEDSSGEWHTVIILAGDSSLEFNVDIDLMWRPFQSPIYSVKLCARTGWDRTALREIGVDYRVASALSRWIAMNNRYYDARNDSENLDHESTDEIVCPYCGEELDESAEWLGWDEDGDIECPECEKTFYAMSNISVSYSTEKKEVVETNE